MPPIPTLMLNNGVTIPQLGFGVSQISPDEVVEPVETAIGAGYRHFRPCHRPVASALTRSRSTSPDDGPPASVAALDPCPTIC
jgi:hypothetical protein